VMERFQSLRMKAQHEREEGAGSELGGDGDVEMQLPGASIALKSQDEHEPGRHDRLDAEEGSHDDDSIDGKTHPLAQELHSVFPFSSRELHEFLIQEMLLLDSLFLSLWATNFITMSLHSNEQIAYNLLFLLPIFLMTLLNFLIMFVTSTLFAVTSLKNKGAEWICEQNDICEKVLPNLRREILNLLPDGATDKRLEELYQLITAMRCCPTSLVPETDTETEKGKMKMRDDAGEGVADEGISREGFAELLRILEMHPSEKEIRALFRSMDKDDRSLPLSLSVSHPPPSSFSLSSGSIDLSELKALLLDPNVAKPKPSKQKKCPVDL
jgi:hypothetical protein